MELPLLGCLRDGSAGAPSVERMGRRGLAVLPRRADPFYHWRSWEFVFASCLLDTFDESGAIVYSTVKRPLGDADMQQLFQTSRQTLYLAAPGNEHMITIRNILSFMGGRRDDPQSMDIWHYVVRSCPCGASYGMCWVRGLSGSDDRLFYGCLLCG